MPHSELSPGDILIVDDHMPTLNVLAKLLTQQGYQVRQARDGATALMIANSDPPDLILLDVNMPEMDGFAVCRKLKATAATRDIPVVFVTGLDDTVDKLQGFEAGGVDYITKPFRADEVAARIEVHLTIANLRATLEQRNRQLDERVTELDAISQIAQIVATTGDLLEMLTAVARTIVQLFNIRAVLIMVPTVTQSELQILAGGDDRSALSAVSNTVYSLDEIPVSQQVMASRKTHPIPDVTMLQLSDAVQTLVDQLEIRSGLIVPLIAHDELYGTLVLCQQDAVSTFSPSEIALAETIAIDIAGALERARLVEQAQAAAVDAERQRLARELHDSVTQSLYSIILLCGGWENMAVQGQMPNPAEPFKQLSELSQQVLREMRLLIHQLRPSAFEDGGLVEAIQKRLDIVESRSNVASELLTEGNLDSLSRNLEEQLFYIAQEALNNALRHSRASQVCVRIVDNGRDVALHVIDNGRGFDIDHVATGLGLETMRERAETIGGKLTIQSDAEMGTRVLVTAVPHEHLTLTEEVQS